jgi:hypothetical protein
MAKHTPTRSTRPARRAAVVTNTDTGESTAHDHAITSSDTPAAPVAAPAADGKIERFAVPLDPKTGEFVWDSMRGSTKEKLTKAIKASGVGADAKGDAAADAAINMLLANVLYDAIGAMSMAIAVRRGFTKSSAELLRYTPEEKAQLIGPTVAVLDKYDFLKSKYKEEILLLIAVGGVTGQHVMAMQRAEAAIISPPAGAAS